MKPRDGVNEKLSLPPWPVGAVPWPAIGKGADFYANTRANLMKAAGLESVWVVGPEEGPIRFGSAADPREMWTRLRTASAVPVYVHDLRWAHGMLGRRLARALQATAEGREINPEAARRMVDDEAGRLGIALIDHRDFIRQLDDEAPRAYARWFKATIGRDFDPATIPAPQTPAERAADKRKLKRELAKDMREHEAMRETRRLERLIERHGSSAANDA